jgi:hypothetical protein
MPALRRGLALAAVVLGTLGGLACSDSSGPSTSDPTAEFDATYDLKTINGQGLPFAFENGVQLVSERYTLRKDGTVTDRIVSRQSSGSADQTTTLVGTWSRNGNDLAFSESSGDDYTATLGGTDGKTLTLTITGDLVAVYER